jgi:hypothetical protein
MLVAWEKFRIPNPKYGFYGIRLSLCCKVKKKKKFLNPTIVSQDHLT